MNNIKIMASAQAAKAFVAAILAALSAGVIAAPDGFTLAEVLTIAVAIVVTFQGTYWTTNSKTYDGAIVVAEAEGKKVFSLNLNSDPDTLDTKDAVTFKITK